MEAICKECGGTSWRFLRLSTQTKRLPKEEWVCYGGCHWNERSVENFVCDTKQPNNYQCEGKAQKPGHWKTRVINGTCKHEVTN